MVEAANSPPRLDGIRVLVLFGGSDLFGQERANIEVFSALAELGLKAKFIVSSRWGHEVILPELQIRGFEVTSAPYGFHWGKYLFGKYFYYFFRNVWGLFRTSWRVWREASRWRATHVYAPNWLYLTYAFPGVLFSKLPLVYRMGDKPPEAGSFQWRMLRGMWRRVTAAVAISQFIRCSAQESGLSIQRLSVIHSCPPRRFAPSPDQLPTACAPVILYLGQLAVFKGVEVLLEAAALLVADGVEFEVWLAGKPSWGTEYEEQIQRKIVELQLVGRIKVLGYIQDVDALFRLASLHVVPSLCDEALGNVVLEAKAQGVPSVVFPDGGLPELIEHEVDGFICREKSAAALKEGVEFLLLHEGRRLAAGKAAQLSLHTKFNPTSFRSAWARVFLETSL